MAKAVTTLEVGAGRTESASSVKCSSLPPGSERAGIVRPVPASNQLVQARAKIESGSRVIAIVALTLDLTMGNNLINSAVDPE
jgi:hypothetical protein